MFISDCFGYLAAVVFYFLVFVLQVCYLWIFPWFVILCLGCRLLAWQCLFAGLFGCCFMFGLCWMVWLVWWLGCWQVFAWLFSGLDGAVNSVAVFSITLACVV